MTADPTPAPVPPVALEPGDLAECTMRDYFRPGATKRVIGEVIWVTDDGSLVTISVPQDGASPMEVTALAVEFTLVRTSPDVEAAYERGVAAGRTAAAAEIEAERVERAKTACCEGTGRCGDRECQIDCAVDCALADAATIAEGTDS